MSSYVKKGIKHCTKKNPPLSALVKDVTSFFSWGCRDMWHFPCGEVYFSFGKGWKTIWVVYYFRHILHSCSPLETEAAFFHFCHAPLFPCTKPHLIKHTGLDPWLMQTQASIKLCWSTPGDLHLITNFCFFCNIHLKLHPSSSLLSFFNLMPSTGRHTLITPLYPLADIWSPNHI